MKNGNKEEKFSKAYVEYNKLVYKYILEKIRHVQDAEDLTQKTFIRFFKSKFNTWDDQAYLEKYLFSIAKNCYRNHVRFMTTNPARNFILIEGVAQIKDNFIKNCGDSLANTTNLETVAGSCDADTLTYQEELNQLIEKLVAIIASMPPKQKEAMIEVYINGLKPRHAAIKLNSKANRITFLIHKGKEQLKKKLKNV